MFNRMFVITVHKRQPLHGHYTRKPTVEGDSVKIQIGGFCRSSFSQYLA